MIVSEDRTRTQMKELRTEIEFRWVGHLLVRGLFEGEHIFEISASAAEGVRLVHREEFRGVLVPLFWSSLDTHTRQGFEAMKAALKKRAEEE